MLILSSLSVAGVVLMDHDTNQKCPLATMLSSNCETIVAGVASVLHHITGFKMLTEVLVASGTSVLVVLVLVVTLLFFNNLNTSHADSSTISERISIQERISVSILNPILRWIALHNKRNSRLDLWRVVA